MLVMATKLDCSMLMSTLFGSQKLILGETQLAHKSQ